MSTGLDKHTGLCSWELHCLLETYSYCTVVSLLWCCFSELSSKKIAVRYHVSCIRLLLLLKCIIELLKSIFFVFSDSSILWLSCYTLAIFFSNCAPPPPKSTHPRNKKENVYEFLSPINALLLSGTLEFSRWSLPGREEEGRKEHKPWQTPTLQGNTVGNIGNKLVS